MLWLTLRACRPAATVATKHSLGYQSAVCGGGHEMTAGVHCARFEMRKLSYALVGVAGPGFDPAAGGAALGSVGWVMSAGDGWLWHGGSRSEWTGHGPWIVLQENGACDASFLGFGRGPDRLLLQVPSR